MVNREFSTNQTASGLTGGNINDVFFFFGGAILTIDAAFSAQAIVLGRNIANTIETGGFLDCRAGFTVTFGTGFVADGGFGYTVHLWIHANGSGIRDDTTTPTKPGSPITFTRQNNHEQLFVINNRANPVWSVLFYNLVRPVELISVFNKKHDTVNFSSIEEARSLLLDFGDVIAINHTPRQLVSGLLVRRGNVSRTEKRGFSPEIYSYSLFFDEEKYDEYINLKLLLYDDSNTFFLVTDKEVLLDYDFLRIQGPNRVWATDTNRLRATINFREKVL